MPRKKQPRKFFVAPPGHVFGLAFTEGASPECFFERYVCVDGWMEPVDSFRRKGFPGANGGWGYCRYTSFPIAALPIDRVFLTVIPREPWMDVDEEDLIMANRLIAKLDFELPEDGYTRNCDIQ